MMYTELKDLPRVKIFTRIETFEKEQSQHLFDITEIIFTIDDILARKNLLKSLWAPLTKFINQPFRL